MLNTDTVYPKKRDGLENHSWALSKSGILMLALMKWMNWHSNINIWWYFETENDVSTIQKSSQRHECCKGRCVASTEGFRTGVTAAGCWCFRGQRATVCMRDHRARFGLVHTDGSKLISPIENILSTFILMLGYAQLYSILDSGT